MNRDLVYYQPFGNKPLIERMEDKGFAVFEIRDALVQFGLSDFMMFKAIQQCGSNPILVRTLIRPNLEDIHIWLDYEVPRNSVVPYYETELYARTMLSEENGMYCKYPKN